MTNKVDVYKSYFTKAWSNLPTSLAEAGATYLSDDFKNLDSKGNVVMNREAYIGMGTRLAAAFKNFKGVYSNLREEGDSVIATFHFEGVHTAPLDLTPIGMGMIPASGKAVVWPDATARFTVKGDKITSIQEISGGMEWFLAPLGVTLQVR